VVAISINLSRILEVPGLSSRAAEALIPLAGVAVISLLGIVPDQSIRTFGWETLAAGALTWLASGVIHLRSLPLYRADPRSLRWSRILLANIQSLPFVAAGVLLIQEGTRGLYLIAGILNTWVLLIEILR
jgi:modulator of FtsH protease